jgi:hypothetical protein
METEKLKSAYDAIKVEENKIQSQKTAEMKEFHSRIGRGNQQRIKNASPFYKNQQGKRFGIDGAKKITS